jgi:hypothetical protein
MSLFRIRGMRRKRRNRDYFFFIRFLTGYALVFSLFSCQKDPDSIGRNLLPGSDNIYVYVDSSTQINSYTISGKRLITSGNELYALGSLKDSIFGFSSASILTQFHPRILLSADSLRKVDSLVLTLSSANYYGDSLQEMVVHVYELTQYLEIDTNYFSDINPLEYFDYSDEIATATYHLGDSLIRVKIEDPDFISIFENLPDSVFKDRLDFAEVFKGFYFAVDDVNERGGYNYLNLSSGNTLLIMYYNGDTISYGYEMGFTSIAAKANVFRHDYSGFPIESRLNFPDSDDTLIYIEGLGGTSGRLSFPAIDDWKAKGPLTINKAELILPVDTVYYPGLTDEAYPPKLLLLVVDSSDTYDYLYDYRIDEGGSYFNGSYDKTRNAYIFNIGLHLQSYLSGSINNFDMVVVSRGSYSSANRVILKSPGSQTSPLKLKVIYTDLN